ncbi:uncharacterized protein LOC116769262 [Danaus plexippus]|nr:uncharacterized protein LOC116769262 [Danaus plexippus plexippus]XP_032516194.1 uncharacterized protein LOC116769262 [Danaus plexippus]XP_032516195.1 uncharacterized protein LOC116769262 [Danaus plexippus plexippus]
MSPSKEIVFSDDLTTCIIKKLFSDSCYAKFNNGYCWFQLMQIYDKICDCIHLFNNIYAKQILFMFNCWLLSTLLAICRLISPSLKNNDTKNTDIYYYIFINLRPLFIATFSDLFIEGRRKTLHILMHCLVHHELDPEQRSQISIMLALVKARRLELSAQVCPVTLKIMIDFAGRVISYTILIIQHFYNNL